MRTNAEIHLLLTDFPMPGLSGLKLALPVLEEHPDDPCRIECWKIACAVRRLHVRLFDQLKPAPDWLLK